MKSSFLIINVFDYKGGELSYYEISSPKELILQLFDIDAFVDVDTSFIEFILAGRYEGVSKEWLWEKLDKLKLVVSLYAGSGKFTGKVFRVHNSKLLDVCFTDLVDELYHKEEVA